MAQWNRVERPKHLSKTLYDKTPKRSFVVDLAGDVDFHAIVRDAVGADGEDNGLALATIDAALAVAIAEMPVAALGSLADLAQVESVPIEARARGGYDARAAEARVAGGLGGGSGEAASVGERAADAEDNAHGHGGGEHGGHGGDDGADGVIAAGGVAQEPEEHVDHVDEPDRNVQVEAITEHQLPVGDGLEVEGLDRALDGEDGGNSVQKSGGDPVDADP